MNILLYTTFYPAPVEMGTQRDTMMFHYFAKVLQEAGHRVQVVFLSLSLVQRVFRNRCRDILPTETDYVYEGIPVHLIRAQFVTPHRRYPHSFQAALINRRLRAFKSALGWKADRVFVHIPTSFTGITEIFADGVPVLGDFHNMDVLALKMRGGEKAARFIRQFPIWGYRNSRVQTGLKAIEDRPMLHICSGIDRSLLAPEQAVREKLDRFPEPMRILYAGNLIPLKNVDILIQAVQKLRFPWEFTIVGDGPEQERLQSLAAGSSNIHFTGRLKREETVARMREADVFIMLSSPETYGLVYLEAMAQGCLTVASKGEGFDGLIVDGQNGFLAQPFSVEEAVAVLERIDKLNPEQRRDIAQRGYSFARSMTEDQTAQKLLEQNR